MSIERDKIRRREGGDQLTAKAKKAGHPLTLQFQNMNFFFLIGIVDSSDSDSESSAEKFTQKNRNSHKGRRAERRMNEMSTDEADEIVRFFLLNDFCPFSLNFFWFSQCFWCI